MSTDSPDVVTRFESDMTLRWSCKAGDHILWFRWTAMLSSKPSISIRDMWETKDGDFITITNRIPDLPGWFRLYPGEVCGVSAYLLDEQPNADFISQPMEATNIWRIMTGDRLAWLSYSGPHGTRVESVLDMRACAAALGDNARGLTFDEYAAFGGLSEDESPPEKVRLAQQAVRTIREMGVSNAFAEVWRFG